MCSLIGTKKKWSYHYLQRRLFAAAILACAELWPHSLFGFWWHFSVSVSLRDGYKLQGEILKAPKFIFIPLNAPIFLYFPKLPFFKNRERERERERMCNAIMFDSRHEVKAYVKKLKGIPMWTFWILERAGIISSRAYLGLLMALQDVSLPTLRKGN